MEEENKIVDTEVSADESVVETALPTEEAPVVSETQAESPASEEKSVSAEEKSSEKGKKKKKKDKEETPAKSKRKRVLNAIFLGFQILLVLFAITICLIVILNPKGQDEISPLAVKLLPVRSGSMDGTAEIDGKKYTGFPKWSLVIATNVPNGGKDLKVGQVVTFVDQTAEGTKFLNTHRIVAVEKYENPDGSMSVRYQTQGDAYDEPDTIWKTPDMIKAVYSFHIPRVGYAIKWIREGYHFVFVVIIPLGLLFLYNIYLVAQIVMESKMRKAKALAAEKAKADALASIDEEEIKRKAIEEYLKSQAMAAENASSQDNKGDTE